MINDQLGAIATIVFLILNHLPHRPSIEPVNYSIVMNVKGAPDGSRILLCKAEGKKLDTLAIQATSRGKVKFSGTINESELVFIFTANRAKGYIPVLIAGGDNYIQVELEDWPKASKFGPPASLQYDSIQAVLNEYRERRKRIEDSMAKYNSASLAKERELADEWNRLNQAYFDTLVPELIERNLNSVFIPFVIQNISRMTVDKKQKVYERLPDAVKQGKYGRDLREFIDLRSRIDAASKENKAPDFSFRELRSGKLYSLADLASDNKVLYVDFWASWCKPCRAQFPSLKNTYLALKAKGFEILGVSLDKDTLDMNKAIEDDGLVWLHTYVGSQSKSDILGLYEISSIPRSILVDSAMNIIGKDLHGVQLHNAIENYLSRINSK